MKFVNTFWLLAIPFVVVGLIVLFYFTNRWRVRSIAKFASAKLLHNLISAYSPRRRRLKHVLFLIGVSLILVSLARPQWGHRIEEQRAKGVDVIFALDTSKSMLAEDIKPNRLERSKYAILDLVAQLKTDRVGLIAFSGNAFLQCPLTLDYNAFQQTLTAVDTNVIQRGGTNVAGAIEVAEQSFAKEDNFKFLILITDGEDLESAGIQRAKAAASSGVKIYTVGIGTESGELIPITGADGKSDFLRDASGKVVKTRLDSQTLETIANVTGGFYSPLGSTGEGLVKAYEAGLRSIPPLELRSSFREVPREQFQWFLAAGIFFITWEWLMGTRRRGKVAVKKRRRWMLSRNNAACFVMTFLFLFLSQKLSATPQAGFNAFNDGRYEDSIKQYREALDKKPDDATLQFNLADAFYKNGDFEAADRFFNQAIHSKDLKLQQDAFYNLANTRYRLGDLAKASGPEKAMELWDEALKGYQSAIDLDSHDSEAHENFEFVKKKLDELKKQQQQKQEKQDKQDQKKQNQQDNKDQQEKQKQDQENKQSQDNKNQEQQQKNQEDQQKDQKNKDDQQSKSGQDSKKEDAGKKDSSNSKDSQKETENKKQNEDHHEKSSGNGDKDKDEKQGGGSSADQAKNSDQPKRGETQGNSRSAGKGGDAMSREEALTMLNAMAGDEKKFPMVRVGGNGKMDTSETNYKDW